MRIVQIINNTPGEIRFYAGTSRTTIVPLSGYSRLPSGYRVTVRVPTGTPSYPRKYLYLEWKDGEDGYRERVFAESDYGRTAEIMYDEDTNKIKLVEYEGIMFPDERNWEYYQM